MKKNILQLARSKGGMTYQNKNKKIKIAFYPDYSAELQCRRDRFRAVKCLLRDKGDGTVYVLIYPAQLCVKHLGTVKLFSTLAEVQSFLKELSNE